MASQEKVSQKVQEAIFAQLLNNPINGQCADCHTASPNWVSLDFGVFICMRCSGVHRQLGPHISRVRSLKLDGWTRDNIEIMATVGNKIANDYYEYKIPTGSRRPGTNASADECRRFIDDKYINKKWIPQGFPEPVKDFVACRQKGTKPDFSYSQQKQNKQQSVTQPVVKPEQPQPQPHHGIKFTRKKSASLDKVDHHHDKKPAQPTNHPDLLTQDIDLLGSYSEPSDDNQGIHSASPPPKKINFANFKKAQSQPATHPLHHHQSVPDLTTTFPWAAQGGQQHQQQGGNTAQAQPQENKVDVMKLYSQPQGHQNHFMQGMNPGWQQYGNYGGMNQGYNTGYNMGHQNHFQGGYQQNYGTQQGFQGGQNMGNMGYNPYMNYGNQQGHAQNQFGNNNGFVQAQGPNSLF